MEKVDKAEKLSNVEVSTLFLEIVMQYYHYLKSKGVAEVWSKNVDDILNRIRSQDFDTAVDEMSCASLWLVFLYKNIGRLVSKNAISDFVRQYKEVSGDQQVRHLSSQHGWYVLGQHDIIPWESDPQVVPSGYYLMVSLKEPHPNATVQKRKENLSAKTFSELKQKYNLRCATCGAKEGEIDRRTGKIIKLQKGHKNPTLPLRITNAIPQCQYCNQTLKDTFCYDEFGVPKWISDPKFVLRSPISVQQKMLECLKNNLE